MQHFIQNVVWFIIIEVYCTCGGITNCIYSEVTFPSVILQYLKWNISILFDHFLLNGLVVL